MSITVTYEGLGRWVARFPWSVAAKDRVKAAGFRFNGDKKIWYTDNADVAAKFGDREQIAAEVRLIEANHKVSVDASRATDSSAEIPAPAGLEYLPYQKAGIAYATARRDTLIGDEMGLGKTIQALGLINSDPTIANTLVICPASLKLNWIREARKWLVRPVRITLANGMFPAGGFVVTNYEMVQKYRKQIDAVQWDLLICDESHYLKNSQAKRTHAILGQYDADAAKRVMPIAARRRVFLTGTPILNRPAELWTLCKALDPAGLGASWMTFHRRYCNAFKGRYGWDTTGASHLDELQTKLRQSIMVRRLKADVLTELPAKRRQIITLLADNPRARSAVAREQQVIADIEARLNGLRAQVEALSVDEASDAYKAAALALRQAYAVAFEETSAVRHEVALAKLPQVIEHIENCLEGGGKLVLFIHHHDCADELAKALAAYKPVMLTGRDNLQARDDAVRAFQTDPAVRVFIGSMHAAGVGLTLTAASHVVFGELDWTPGILAQAEDRCHRIGQRDQVLVQHIVLDGSLDARMTELIVSKMDVIAEAIGG